jgi:formylmethanofuran dehydrogenase subunit D
MEIAVTVVTFEDIFQYEAKEMSRYSEDYKKLSAQIFMDKQDMVNLGVNDGQNVLVKNDIGSVVLAVKTSDDDPHPGLVFMITSPWANQLVRDDICETIVPGFTRISAQLPIRRECHPDIRDLPEDEGLRCLNESHINN